MTAQELRPLATPRPDSCRGAQRDARSPSSIEYFHFNSPVTASRATTARRVPAVA